SGAPTSFSSARIDVDRPDCTMCSRSAARVKLRSSASATKWRRCRNSILQLYLRQRWNPSETVPQELVCPDGSALFGLSRPMSLQRGPSRDDYRRTNDRPYDESP